MAEGKKQGTWIVVLLVVIVALLAFVFMGSNNESIRDTADEFGDNVEETVEDLDPNRTVGEEIGDAIGDAGKEIQESAEGN